MRVTLTLLAWAATEDGEHEQALALFDQTPATASFRRGDAGAGDRPSTPRPPCGGGERIRQLAAGRILTARWLERSALSPQIDVALQVRPATARRSSRSCRSFSRNRRPGKHNVTSDGPPNLHPDNQLIQWLDSLIQFAPLEELEIAFAGIGDDVRQRDLLRDAIRTRALSPERRLRSRRAPPDGRYRAAEAESGVAGNPDSRPNVRMTRAGLGQRVAPLAGALRGTRKIPTRQRAGRNSISPSRGTGWSTAEPLTLPSLALMLLCRQRGGKTGPPAPQERAPNSGFRAMGFTANSITATRRPMRSNTRWKPPRAVIRSIAAPALELANQCLFRRAEFSLYQKSRAMETAATKLSADLHRQLRERFPAFTPKQNARSISPSPRAAGPWMPGDYNSVEFRQRPDRRARSATTWTNSPTTARLRQKIDALTRRFDKHRSENQILRHLRKDRCGATRTRRTARAQPIRKTRRRSSA